MWRGQEMRVAMAYQIAIYAIVGVLYLMLLWGLERRGVGKLHDAARFFMDGMVSVQLLNCPATLTNGRRRVVDQIAVRHLHMCLAFRSQLCSSVIAQQAGD